MLLSFPLNSSYSFVSKLNLYNNLS
uniref:Uncharacterized protein n=1 Tax=Arundo donax TaxID=35708 RepID=A0A0A9H201_ARUDO